MLGWLLDWLESTAEKVAKTKLRIFALQMVVVTSIIFSIVIGVEFWGNMVTTRIVRQEVAYPLPTEGGFKMCETGSLVNIGFPTVSSRNLIEEGLEMMLKKLNTCNAWYNVGYRGEEGTEHKGFTLQKTRKGAVVKRTVWPRSGHEMDGEELQTACKDDNCLVDGYFGLCHEMDDTDKCSYMAFLEDPIDRIIGLYNENCVEYGTDMVLHTRDEGKKSCREMDILEFADTMGNVYVKEFASLYFDKLPTIDCEINMGGFYEQECAPFYRTSDYELARAKLHVTKHVMVFPMTDLIRGLSSLSYLIADGNFDRQELSKKSVIKPYVPINPNWKVKVSTAKRKKLANILRHDVKLYKHVKETYEKEYKMWKPLENTKVKKNGGYEI